MPEITADTAVVIDFDAECGECGSSLDVEWEERRGLLKVTPCKTCEQAARDAGYADKESEIG